MKLLLIAAPIVSFALFVLVRALIGRPLSRFVLNVTVALFLLVYVLVTAALGIFWVARMDLPAFDLHYLFGYCVVLLVVVHLSFQLKILGTYVRRVSPQALLVPDRNALRPGVRRAFAVLGLLLVLLALGWFVASAFAPGPAARMVVVPPASTSASEPRAPAPVRLFIEEKGGRISAFDYLHRESSYSRAGILRSVGVAPERPLELKSYPGAESVALPRPRARAGVRFGVR